MKMLRKGWALTLVLIMLLSLAAAGEEAPKGAYANMVLKNPIIYQNGEVLYDMTGIGLSLTGAVTAELFGAYLSMQFGEEVANGYAEFTPAGLSLAADGLSNVYGISKAMLEMLLQAYNLPIDLSQLFGMDVMAIAEQAETEAQQMTLTDVVSAFYAGLMQSFTFTEEVVQVDTGYNDGVLNAFAAPFTMSAEQLNQAIAAVLAQLDEQGLYAQVAPYITSSMITLEEGEAMPNSFTELYAKLIGYIPLQVDGTAYQCEDGTFYLEMMMTDVSVEDGQALPIYMISNVGENTYLYASVMLDELMGEGNEFDVIIDASPEITVSAGLNNSLTEENSALVYYDTAYNAELAGNECNFIVTVPNMLDILINYVSDEDSFRTLYTVVAVPEENIEVALLYNGTIAKQDAGVSETGTLSASYGDVYSFSVDTVLNAGMYDGEAVIPAEGAIDILSMTEEQSAALSVEGQSLLTLLMQKLFENPGAAQLYSDIMAAMQPAETADTTTVG